MKTFHRPGLPLRLEGAPVQSMGAAPPVKTVTLSAGDAPGLRAEALVAEGDAVAVGTPIFSDRVAREILVCAPVSGIVDKVTTGARRRLTSITLRLGGERQAEIPVPREPDAATARALLMRAGFWPAFRERPFGIVPGPGTRPDAIFVNAVDRGPLAPDPLVAIEGRTEDLSRGAAFLALLTDGIVHVCQPPGPPLVTGPRLRCTAFSGGHPAGLPGTHIDALHPLGPGQRVWQIDAQEVAAIGHLLRLGVVDGTRVIALAGPGVAAPRLLRAPLGAALEDLAAGQLHPGPMRLLSGGPLDGEEAPFLRRLHRQVTALPRPEPRRARVRWPLAGLVAPRPLPLIPSEALELAFGPRLPVVPLLRALSVGDTETAARLGAAGLLEEDLALAGYAAGNGADFAAALRRSLDAMAAEAA